MDSGPTPRLAIIGDSTAFHTHHRGRPVMRGDVREDITQEDIEAGYAELRWDYLESAPVWEIPHELFAGGRDLRTPPSSGHRTPDSSLVSSVSSFEYIDTPCEGPRTSLDQPLQLYIGDGNETEGASSASNAWNQVLVSRYGLPSRSG